MNNNSNIILKILNNQSPSPVKIFALIGFDTNLRDNLGSSDKVLSSILTQSLSRMSLPQGVALNDENFLVSDNFGGDPDFVYFHSLPQTDGISDKSMLVTNREESIATPLDTFLNTVEFNRDA